MTQFYTGVGSRDVPTDIYDFMVNFAMNARMRNMILRSGGAPGSDTAFATGAGGHMVIYRPEHSNEAAEALAAQYHPNWNACSPYVRKLHGRNAFQVLGNDLASPSYCVICWTPDGCIHHNERTRQTGGTGTAISIASMSNIPVWNLQRLDHKEHVQRWMAAAPVKY